MSLEDQLKSAAASLAKESARPLHLSERELLDFLRGELEDFESERVRSHLVTCRNCMGEYRAVQSFLQPEEKPDPTTLDHAWAEFQNRRAPSIPLRSPSFLKKIKESVSLPRLAAASALLAVFATGLWMLYHWPLTSSVVLNAPIVELYPGNFVVQSEQRPQTETASHSHQDPLFLVLIDPLTEQTAEADEFVVEILDQSEALVYTGRGLKRNELGNFNLALGAGFLDPGRYRLVLHADSSSDALAEYQLELK